VLDGLDALVYSAGVVHHQRPEALSAAAVREQLETNLEAPLWLGAQALERLTPGGAIVLIGSTLGHRPLATSAAYSAAKAGLVAVAKSLALAGAERHVRVNVVSPGVIATEMMPPARLAALLPQEPLGRHGEPAEVAAAVLHLLSAPFVTGADWVIDGGMLLRE
jgi:NAD(P)-dependent dehydrogenase (short-subunit alcohol dehydrogenase family)